MAVLSPYSKHILLADDDSDDRLIFGEAIQQLPLVAKLSVVNDGEQLMQWLANNITRLPDLLFLDLNMPRKNGFECLSDIRSNPILNTLPVIIFSSSYAPEAMEKLYNNGAQYYVRKPDDIANYIKVIYHAFHLRHKAAAPA